MYTVPTSLSPSRVESFTSCPMAFRFSSIEKLPEPPSAHLTKGSLVHLALEFLFQRPPAERTPDEAVVCLDEAIAEYRHHPDFTLLELTEAQQQSFFTDCHNLISSYLAMEDPTQVRAIGLELRIHAPVGDLRLVGIIDRLELDDDGELVVTDYKTGRAPGPRYEQGRLAGVHFYSFLCEQVFGRRPSKIRLMYLKTGETIEAIPSQQSVRFITTRTTAVWKAVEKACVTGDFRPRPGAFCASCSFQKWCPAFGGDPALAAAEAPLALVPPAAA